MRLLLPLFAFFAVVHLSALAQDDSTDNAIHAITTLHPDGTKTVSVTDPDKHSCESSIYDAGDKLVQKVVYALDDTNQPVTGIVYNAQNRAMYKATYKHDDTANRIKEEDDYTMDDQLIRRYVYDFSPDGKVSRIHVFDAQGNEFQATDAKKDQRQSLPRVH
jgi:hypothetical protein